MISGRKILKLKNMVKQTQGGRVLRDLYLRRGFYSREYAEETVKKYLGSNISKQYMNELIDDMIIEAKKYNIAFYEYMMYQFYAMPVSERREYVSSLERIAFCERMNNLKNVIIFDDKGKTYQKYKKWYKRDFLEINGGGNRRLQNLFKEAFSFHSKAF